MGTMPQPERNQNLRRSGGLDLIDENHMRKPSGWPIKGHWTLPAKVLQGDIKRLSWRMRVHHKPTAEPTAEATVGVTLRAEAEATVGVTLGVEAEVEAEVTAGLMARVFLRVALRVGNWGPLVDLHLGGGWPLENLRWSWTPKEVWRTTCRNSLFQMWRHGWSSKPANWAHQHGGQSSWPFQGWRTHENVPARFSLLLYPQS